MSETTAGTGRMQSRFCGAQQYSALEGPSISILLFESGMSVTCAMTLSRSSQTDLAVGGGGRSGVGDGGWSAAHGTDRARDVLAVSPPLARSKHPWSALSVLCVPLLSNATAID